MQKSTRISISINLIIIVLIKFINIKFNNTI